MSVNIKNYLYSPGPGGSAADGFVALFCTLLLLTVFGMAAFVIDIGNARYQRRNIQIASDACSMAALVALGISPTYNSVRNEVWDIAQRNGVAQAEVTNIDCGTWSAGVFTSQGMNAGVPICNYSTNAVQVSMSRQVNTFFGRILGTNFIAPATLAVASRIAVNRCIRPFVISNTLLVYNGGPLIAGSTFDTGLLSSGNWGKLDPTPGVGGSGFVNNSMSTNSCHTAFVSGPADTEQGFSSVKQAFDNAIADPSYANGMVFAVTSANPQGNSPNTVPIVEYIKADLIGVYGNNANNWYATFRIVARNVLPDPDPTVTTRKLVL